jgi:integrase
MHVLLKQALRDAVRSNYIRTNPLAEVKPPKQHRKEIDVLTPDQVKHLLDTVKGDRLECVYVLGALCGLRIGEVLSLRFADLDLDRGILKVERTLWNGKTSHTKTPSSRRTLKLPQRVLESLERLCNTADGQAALPLRH